MKTIKASSMHKAIRDANMLSTNYPIMYLTPHSYFEGLNSMGLRFERTRPVRIVSRPDQKNSGMVSEKFDILIVEGGVDLT